MILDPVYFLFIGPALLLSLWASWRTKSAFGKYSKVKARSGLNGAQAAKRLLDGAGIDDVQIVPTRGVLSPLSESPATRPVTRFNTPMATRP